MTPGVSIVIPTWNGVALLKQFLPSVIEAATRFGLQSHAPAEIIIVDDGSTDETVEWLLSQGFSESEPETITDDAETRRRGDAATEPSDGNESIGVTPGAIIPVSPCRRVAASSPVKRFVSNEINRGFGEACNRGFEAARFPLVLLLNNDVEICREAIAPLVENFADRMVFAAHCRVFELDGNRECGTGKMGGFARGFIRVHQSYAALGVDEKRALNDETKASAPLYSMFAGGGSAMFDRGKFLELGGFDSLLSPFYWEDVELSYRAWKRGYVVVYEPRSVARHRVSSTIGKLKRRKVRNIEQRNRLIYHWIHLHDRRMMASHIAWVLLLALAAPLRLKFGFTQSCAAALRALPQIRKRRREEKRAARRSDKDVFNVFALLAERADVFVYDDYRELQRLSRTEKPSD